MRAVSLRRRVISAGVAVVVIVLSGVDIFVWVNVRGHLLHNLKTVLDNRAALAVAFAPTIDDAELARLAGSEVVVSVRDSSGTEIERGVEEAPSSRSALAGTGPPDLTRRVDLPSGDTVILTASRAGVDRTLRRVAFSEVLGTIFGVGFAALLLTRASQVALRPIDTVVATARQIKSGHTGERLRPDRTETELGRMAVAFDEMLDGLEAALAEARASEEAERRFLAEAAHQLRTPIAGIQASVEALPNARDPAERQQLLAHVAKESARAGRRVAALLSMARLDRGVGPARRRCDIVALCRDEVARAALLTPDLDVGLQSEEPSRLVDVDPDGLREVVANLLDNARRHARSRITVTVTSRSPDIELRVEDDGPGVVVEDAERVFERFVSLDGQGGSGLGLPIVRGIARSYGGKATYEDGAFIVSLPRIGINS